MLLRLASVRPWSPGNIRCSCGRKINIHIHNVRQLRRRIESKFQVDAHSSCLYSSPLMLIPIPPLRKSSEPGAPQCAALSRDCDFSSPASPGRPKQAAFRRLSRLRPCASDIKRAAPPCYFGDGHKPLAYLSHPLVSASRRLSICPPPFFPRRVVIRHVENTGEKKQNKCFQPHPWIRGRMAAAPAVFCLCLLAVSALLR